MFVYSRYWRCWSRTIGYKNGTVEVNLTPLNNNWAGDVEPIIIRRHSTSGNETFSKLPMEVYGWMIESIGEELTHRLLTEDFFPQIDWDKYDAVCNGGASLADITIDRELS